MEGKSKWLVGSSSINKAGFSKSNLASITRIRQPPENWRNGFCKSLV